jgi:HPt (histidine-containing phosphotransfer) domain-containing protein
VQAQAAPPAPPAPAPSPPAPPAPADRQSAEVAILDEKTLEQIRELERGVPNLLAKVAELYIENSASLLHELRGCLHRRDFAGMADAAHALKSTSFNTGAKKLAELCTALEAFAHESNFEETRNVLSDALQEHARVERALQALRAAA